MTLAFHTGLWIVPERFSAQVMPSVCVGWLAGIHSLLKIEMGLQINYIGGHRRIARMREAHTLDAGWRSVRRRVASVAHVAGPPCRAGGSKLVMISRPRAVLGFMCLAADPTGTRDGAPASAVSRGVVGAVGQRRGSIRSSLLMPMWVERLPCLQTVFDFDSSCVWLASGHLPARGAAWTGRCPHTSASNTMPFSVKMTLIAANHCTIRVLDGSFFWAIPQNIWSCPQDCYLAE